MVSTVSTCPLQSKKTRGKPRSPPLPSGRGHEAMTYGRWRLVCANGDVSQAAVSHSAELVRGKCLASEGKPPHSPFGHLLPKGRRGSADADPSRVRPLALAPQINLHHALVGADLVDGAF